MKLDTLSVIFHPRKPVRGNAICGRLHYIRLPFHANKLITVVFCKKRANQSLQSEITYCRKMLRLNLQVLLNLVFSLQI